MEAAEAAAEAAAEEAAEAAAAMEDDEEDDSEEDEDDEVSRRLAPDDRLPSSMEGMVVSSDEVEGASNTQTSESGDLGNEAARSGVSPDKCTMNNPSKNIDTDESNARKEDNSEFNEVSSSMDIVEESGMDAASSRCIHDDRMDDADETHREHFSRTTDAVSSGGGDGPRPDVEASGAPSPGNASSESVYNASHLLTGEELLDFLREVHDGRSKVIEKILTVGMVGYPNVGKSSTINAILREKKVPVSATPGRTKHFQTLFVEPTLCLCDCPGLVMPSFVSTKADMYLNGILPIDQMRDFRSPVSLMCQRVPREVLELTYGMNLIQPAEGEDPDRPPTAMEFLNAHAYVRGFMTQKGVPDSFRSARIILKDYVCGKVLYSIPPPGLTIEEFGSVHFPTSEVGEVNAGCRPKKFSNKPMIDEAGQTVKKSASKKVDESFFAKPSVAHTKAMPPRPGVVGGQSGGVAGVGFMGKPWKKQKRGKKEKLRRIYGHLDEK